MGQYVRSPSSGYSPRRPFLLLAVYFTVATLQVALVAARPPLPGTRVEALWLIAGAGLALLLATLAAWARWWDRGLPLLVIGGVLQSVASVAVAAGGQGQLIAGFYLATLGLYSGYFLPRRPAQLIAFLSAIGYLTALAANPLLDSPAYVLAVLVLIVGVTRIVFGLVQRLQAEVVHDPLTGALNRRGLEGSADLLHGLDARRATPTTIVEIDLDAFKAFNDSRGHQAGDDLLVALVRDWTRVLRRTDLLARTGGDEFVLVLPSTTRAEAEALVTRLRAANDAQWSAGIVVWEPGEPLPEALRDVDEDMYRHKPSRR